MSYLLTLNAYFLNSLITSKTMASILRVSQRPLSTSGTGIRTVE